jgi:hypothetical protein
MNTVTFTDLKKTIKIPGDFNELSRMQVISIAGTLHLPVDEFKKKMLILQSLLKADWNVFRHWIYYYKLTPESKAMCLPLTEFALKPITLTKNLLPVLGVPFSFKKLYGPEDHLKNIVFIEFIKAERNYTRFTRTGEIKYLNELVAILYRPKKKNYNPESPDHDGDIREKYNDYNVVSRVDLVSRISLRKRLAILLYYYGCRKFIIDSPLYKEIFVKEDKKKVEEMRDNYTWETVLNSISENPRHIEEVSYIRLSNVLFSLNLKIKDNKAVISKMENRRK